MLVIHYTSNFVKKWKKLRNKKKIMEKIQIFHENPYNSKLKTHKLKGSLANYWSFSISYKERILFGYKKKNEVIFYDFGSHDIYK